MKLQSRIVFIICSAFFAFSASSASNQFKTDINKLSVANQKRYFEAEKNLNDWAGESEKLDTAGALIEILIKSEPEFLPIYIEKARLTIIRGATGTNDYIKANREALKVISEIQSKDATYAKSYVLAGHVYINLRDFANAKKSLEQAERIGTTDPWLHYNWADLLLHMRQYDEALAHARQALVLSKDNSKALVSAIAFISQYSNYSSEPGISVDISSIVFEFITDPEQRMRVASRLTNAYQGDSMVLDRAYEIIDRQSKETPRLEAVDLAMAEWLLKKGYRMELNYVSRYDPRFSSSAEAILDRIKPTKSANARIFSHKFSIALSNNDLKKAERLLAEADAGDVPHDVVMTSKALLLWLKQDYLAVTQVLESVAEHDPSAAGNKLLMAAYTRLGRADLENAYHKRMIERNPTSAWTLGNYAFFLLYTMDDVDGAIHFGNKALEQMTYPIARNTTALAYLIKASILNR